MLAPAYAVLYSVVMNSETPRQTCQHPSGCITPHGLSWVPGAALVLCVIHKREWNTAHGDAPQPLGENKCPHCKEVFPIRGARGQRARNASRRIADSAFQRHVDTCQTRQRILNQKDSTPA